MKKVLFITQSLSSGGAERRMVNIAIQLKNRGYQPSFLCLREGDFYAHQLHECNIPIEWKTKWNLLFRLFFASRYIRKGHYDVKISFLDVPNIINCISSIGSKNSTAIIGEASAAFEYQKLMGKVDVFKGAIIGYMARFAERLVCNSEHAADLWKKKYPIYNTKIEYIYNPIVLPRVTSVYVPQKNCRTQIVVAASYQWIKNIINVIEAVRLMENKDKIEINWYGRKDAEFEKANTLIEQYSLSDIIHLNSETKDIANRMNEADYVALFSKSEGLPNAICEGMGIGKPIIMTRVSDYHRLVDSNGFLCDAEDIDSIKNALSKAAQVTPLKLREMGDISRRKASELFTSDKIIQEWITLIELART